MVLSIIGAKLNRMVPKCGLIDRLAKIAPNLKIYVAAA